MKRLIIGLVFILNASFALAQKGKKYIVDGNKLYQQQKYKEAENSYRKSAGVSNTATEGIFNLGDALYKQKRFQEASGLFSKIAASSPNTSVVSQAYHNLGNSLLASKKIPESIEAYKKALLANPKDDQTRYNLAYAQQLLKNQQQNKQNQNNKNQQNKEQNKKDQNKNDQNKGQNKKDQDKKNQNKQDQNKQDQNKEQQPQPNQLSKEDAERMLEALNNQEQGTQDKLKNRKIKGARGRISKDW